MILAAGVVVAGVGGIEEGQRDAAYHRMAYLDPDAIAALLTRHVDILVTHQGPSGIQTSGGSQILPLLLDAESARVWIHGHSVRDPNVVKAGPTKRCTVVPLGDIAFPGRGPNAMEPGPDGWCVIELQADHVDIRRTTPPFLREFRMNKWTTTADGRLICPPLARIDRRWRNIRS